MVSFNHISAAAVLFGGGGWDVWEPGCRCFKNLKTAQLNLSNGSHDTSASLNWLTVADMIKTETACMVYKSINDLVSDYLSEMCTKK